MPSDDSTPMAPGRSFSGDTSPWDAIECAASQDLGDALLAQAWVAAARSVPVVARVLCGLASGATRSKPSTLQQVQAFIARPHWIGLADALSRADHAPTRGNEVFLANLSRAVARQTGWAAGEDAFWHALTQCGSVPLCRHRIDLQVLDSVEQCRVVAQWILDAIADGQSTPGSSLTVTEATHALDSLGDFVDPNPILAEVPLCRSIPCHELPMDKARRLASVARLAGYRQASRWRERLARFIQTLEVDQLVESVSDLLNEWLGEHWGIWIAAPGPTAAGFTATGSNTIERPEGVARWMQPGPTRRMLGFAGTRDEFESNMLPPRFRCSRDLASHDGELVGRVYSVDAIDPGIARDWLPPLGASLAVFANRLEARWIERDRIDRMRSAELVDAKEQQNRVLQAIGEFSAGAGHEINNPLGAIAGHASRLLRDEPDPDRRRALQQISAQTDRIRRMIRDLQLIGGRGALQAERVELSDVIDAAARQAEQKLDHGRRTFETCESGWVVRGDRELLTRMVAELVVNGANASGPNGHVTVRAARSKDRPGAYEIIVIDSGPGFSAPERHHAFVPYFSGREAGRGLGMGLPVARRIASDHGGEISISIGKPTTLRVILPAA